DAHANIANGIEQHANAGGDVVGAAATATLTNAGVITVGVTAKAFAGGVPFGTEGDGTAHAWATMHQGIGQHAHAYSSAAVNLVNSGTLNIVANADASA